MRLFLLFSLCFYFARSSCKHRAMRLVPLGFSNSVSARVSTSVDWIGGIVACLLAPSFSRTTLSSRHSLSLLYCCCNSHRKQRPHQPLARKALTEAAALLLLVGRRRSSEIFFSGNSAVIRFANAYFSVVLLLKNWLSSLIFTSAQKLHS